MLYERIFVFADLVDGEEATSNWSSISYRIGSKKRNEAKPWNDLSRAERFSGEGIVESEQQEGIFPDC